MNFVRTQEGASPNTRLRTGQRPAWWSVRIWAGMTAPVWFRLLARHRFRVSPARLHWAVMLFFLSVLTLLPAAVQHRRYRRAIAAEALPPPIFIVGHWRSGTTLLHELLATDRRILTPNFVESFATDHFMSWEGVLRRFGALVPARRPTDDMEMGLDRPQEDEFALLATGAPSPYEVFLFPNDRSGAIDHLALDGKPAGDVRAWRDALLMVMKRVTLSRRRGRSPDDPPPDWFLLKSPTHTARIRLLREMFPRAKFIHISRSPFELFPSSEHLCRQMFQSQGFQRPRYDSEGLELAPFINAPSLLVAAPFQ